jgi:transcriptional regulator with XRE-family HTH domain
MSVTGSQIRMARGALRLTVRDLSEMAEIDKGTISRIEGGANAYSMTLQRLRDVLERAGIVFIEADGYAGPGVRLKLGADIPQRAPVDGTAAGDDGEGGMKAASWDDFEDGADHGALLCEAPALNPDMAEMWRDDPELWARLSEGGRETLSRSMYGDMRAVSAGYFRNGL